MPASRRLYEDVAFHINNIYRYSTDRPTLTMVARVVAMAFKEDNHRFDVDRFMDACTSERPGYPAKPNMTPQKST